MNIYLQSIIKEGTQISFCRALCGEIYLEYCFFMECSPETALFNPIFIGMTIYF